MTCERALRLVLGAMFDRSRSQLRGAGSRMYGRASKRNKGQCLRSQKEAEYVSPGVVEPRMTRKEAGRAVC